MEAKYKIGDTIKPRTLIDIYNTGDSKEFFKAEAKQIFRKKISDKAKEKLLMDLYSPYDFESILNQYPSYEPEMVEFINKEYIIDDIAEDFGKKTYYISNGYAYRETWIKKYDKKKIFKKSIINERKTEQRIESD